MAVHGLLKRGYERMYGCNRTQLGEKYRQAVLDLQGSQGNLEAAQSSGDTSFLASDLPVPKILRARALKSVQWLLDTDTLAELCISVCVTQPAESLLHWLFKQQHDPWFASGLRKKVFGRDNMIILFNLERFQ